jgi:hypothetical protein
MEPIDFSYNSFKSTLKILKFLGKLRIASPKTLESASDEILIRSFLRET